MKKVCIISLTPVTDEPRVLRQADAFMKAGWEVFVCGFKGRQPKPRGWNLIELDPLSHVNNMLRRYGNYRRLILSRWSDQQAENFYWVYSGYESMYQQIAYVEGIRCDFVACHDFFTSPIAARLAKKWGTKYTVDCHEYAIEQYMNDPIWVTFGRPWVNALQRRFLEGAALLTTVCDSIAEALEKDYALPSRPVVIRSLPRYSEMPFRPTGEVINVLYHGLVSANRGLEETIASVPHWRPEFRFIIRGPGTGPYLASLKDLTEKHRVTHRVVFDPPVFTDEMIREANRSDIGYFVQHDISRHKRFALPNKFFEYIMAGLAICAADLPEMAKVLKQRDLGKLIYPIDRHQIAKVINSFTRDEIDHYKMRSLSAAKELCWDQESQIMLKAYESVAN